MKVPNLIVSSLCMSITNRVAAESEQRLSNKPTLRVISSMATRQVLAELIAQFEQQSEYKVELESVGGVDAAKRVEAGEHFDVVILAANAIDKLIDAGRIEPGSRVDLVKSSIAIAVQQGAKIVDVSSEESVKQAVINASSISYSTGPSGTYLTELFERWGITHQIKHRIVKAPVGIPVGLLIARGEVELGFQQLSELLNLPGITILGTLPADIQHVTRFSAGITLNTHHRAAVTDLLSFLASPDADEIKISNGMAPI
ncbi:molybdenum ABC transporter substrate-binding protein [Serratia sp. S1B]|nr:molybdenum ABC transporter substrate-binding protein [Serratia sp. S1B]